MTRASFVARFVAFCVDALFLCIVHALLVAAAVIGHAVALPSTSPGLLFERMRGFSPVLTMAFLFVVLYYFTYLTADGEQTIGKSVCGIRVVTRDGENLGRARAFVRCVCYAVSGIPLFIGFLMALIFRGRSLHDLLCGTMVIKGDV
jgi:uncharacterized RDD family membrane protein YckC